MKQIQKEHIALVIKYTGISFITWWLSHGFFSGKRQIITSLIGIGFFIVWTLMEQKNWEKEYLRTIIFSSMLAVSIWALTWWLQHFPDSPDRSSWIVPLGFLISAYAYIKLEKGSFLKKTNLIYTILWFLLFISISFIFYWVVSEGYIWEWWHKHWNDHHEITNEQNEIIQEYPIKDNQINNKEILEEVIHIDWDWHDH